MSIIMIKILIRSQRFKYLIIIREEVYKHNWADNKSLIDATLNA